MDTRIEVIGIDHGWCGGTLREKQGQFGSFIGCSNYPKCHHTRKKRN